MPAITDPEAATFHEVKQKSPDERQISSRSCCGLCFYNIPSGTMMILLPGLVIVLIGAIMMSMGETDDSWSSNMVGAALIMLVLGGTLTAGGLIFWIIMWCKYQPKVQRKGSVTPTPQVELVAIYRSTPPDYPNGAPPGASVSGRSQNNLDVSAANKAQEIEGGVLPS